MTTNALMELAETLATDMDNHAEEMYQGGSSIYDFAERVRALGKAAEAATQLRTAAAEGQVTVVEDEAGNVVAVTRTDEEHRILETLWTRDLVTHPLEASSVVSQNSANVRDKTTDSGAGRDGWMPIESAPKDGTEVVLLLPATPDAPIRARSGYWQEWHDEVAAEFHNTGEYLGQFPTGDGYGNFWWTWEGDYGHEPPQAEYAAFAPTHWQPLPTPPAIARESK